MAIETSIQRPAKGNGRLETCKLQLKQKGTAAVKVGLAACRAPIAVGTDKIPRRTPRAE